MQFTINELIGNPAKYAPLIVAISYATLFHQLSLGEHITSNKFLVTFLKRFWIPVD